VKNEVELNDSGQKSASRNFEAGCGTVNPMNSAHRNNEPEVAISGKGLQDFFKLRTQVMNDNGRYQ
jgi:hypothetical protein